ncbi:MAG TPA: hypothetical protein VJ259_05140 [Actinomycetota bacterium]|nr:hypothetical protein [Actinomycetota bacterium]
MNPTQRRAIRNGAVAAAATAVVLFGIDAAVPGDEEPRATPTATAATPSPVCEPAWEVATSVDPDQEGNQLLAVTAVAADDVWAVGGFGPPDAPSSTLVERWNGTIWFVVASPNDGTTVNVLNAVAAAAPDNVWAVGRSSSGAGDRPLVEHWDGERWSVSPVAVPGGGVLHGVAAVGRNVWAVGSSGIPGSEQALILRWDGVTWTPEAIPAFPGPSALLAVRAVGPRDVWAIGSRGNRPLVLRFNGTRWRTVPIPARAPLVAIEPVAGGQAWALGSAIYQWDGTTWAPVGAARHGGELHGVAAVSTEDVWAVGSSPGSEEGATRALVQRFDGTRWAIVPGPGVPGSGSGVPGSEALTGAAALPDGTMWAVGYRDTANRRATFAIRGSVTCV